MENNINILCYDKLIPKFTFTFYTINKNIVTFCYKYLMYINTMQRLSPKQRFSVETVIDF